jgi:hypothetical protein
VDPKLYAAKQHLYKYQQALERILQEITGKPADSVSVFEPGVSYVAGWHAVGMLAISVWGLEAFHATEFERHPQWESAATETFRFLSEHCATCGAKMPELRARIVCEPCRERLDAAELNRILTGTVARQTLAYVADVRGDLEAES